MNEDELCNHETWWVYATMRPSPYETTACNGPSLNKWPPYVPLKVWKDYIRHENQVWKDWMFNNLRKHLNFKLEFSCLWQLTSLQTKHAIGNHPLQQHICPGFAQKNYLTLYPSTNLSLHVKSLTMPTPISFKPSSYFDLVLCSWVFLCCLPAFPNTPGQNPVAESQPNPAAQSIWCQETLGPEGWRGIFSTRIQGNNKKKLQSWLLVYFQKNARLFVPKVSRVYI